MLAGVTARQLAEWEAFYLLDASDQDPEITRWDDDASRQDKLRRKAERGNVR